MNTKHYDIFRMGDTSKIYPRLTIPECGELPERKPVYDGNREGEYAWIETHDEDDCDYRIFELVQPVRMDFVNDLEQFAQGYMDSYIAGGRELGWGELEINHRDGVETYRSSAAWKDEPTYYTFGTTLRWTNAEAEDFSQHSHLRVRDSLVSLWSMSRTIYELGMTLTFDEHFKLRIMGKCGEWIRRDECWC